MQTRRNFFKLFQKFIEPLFYYQNFPDPGFTIVFFAYSKHINENKYLTFAKMKNIS